MLSGSLLSLLLAFTTHGSEIGWRVFLNIIIVTLSVLGARVEQVNKE